GIEPAQARVRRRDHDLVIRPDTEVSRSARRQAPVVEGGAELLHLGPRDVVEAHDPATSSASRKNDGPPKFPDLKATASPRSSSTIHGTPTLISGPTRADRSPSSSATATEVSPPATTSRRTPSLTSAPPMRPMVSSIRRETCAGVRPSVPTGTATASWSVVISTGPPARYRPARSSARR